METFAVQSVISEGTFNSQGYRLLSDFIASTGKKMGPKYENYTASRFDLENHLCYDLLLKDGEVVTGTGIYNGGRYPNGFYRIMNRVFVAPHFRTYGPKYPFWATRYILESQLSQYRDCMSCFFTSREGENGNYFLQFWIDGNREVLGEDWIVSDKLFHVAPGGEDKRCFQYVAFPRPMKEAMKKVESITLSQWQELPG